MPPPICISTCRVPQRYMNAPGVVAVMLQENSSPGLIALSLTPGAALDEWKSIEWAVVATGSILSV